MNSLKKIYGVKVLRVKIQFCNFQKSFPYIELCSDFWKTFYRFAKLKIYKENFYTVTLFQRIPLLSLK